MIRVFDRVYLFFFLAMASGAVSRVFGGYGPLQAGGANSTAISSGNSDPILLLFSMLLAAMTVIGVLRKLGDIGNVFLGMIGLPLLYLLAALSIAWSAGPTNTLRGCIYLFTYLGAAAYLAMSFDEKALLEYIAKIAVVMGVLSVAGEFLLPANGDLAPGWSGIFPQKNDLGAAMAIGIAALVAMKGRWNVMRIGGLALCTLLLLLSQSFTAGLMVTAAVFAVLYVRCSGQIRTLLVLSMMLLALVLVFSMHSASDLFTRTTGKDMTFTGRTEIWEMVEEKIRERPLLGFGYDAFWATQADAINQFSVWKPGQAHNGYLDICLNLGAAGLGLVVLLVRESLRLAKRLRTEYGNSAGLWLLVVVLMLLVRNCAEASFLDLSLMWCMLLMAAVSAKEAERRVNIATALARYRAQTVQVLTHDSAAVLSS